ncbi:HD domain-containing phosphohydrolase [Paramagnetospirillum magneticum]|uniref:Response regulator containing a CheY-like receiver domain and an HD-GYP domain n=1 Tax=Paramagnetospirillum magneticum (strain ATCC 700264 / AMB-1) TaxID=342108 RepID=Q2W1N1_PARM1|nr:HD domain-containing phosphohydrolase [Paramagnetospirillum magneticum]BAE52244.1 Response regulator containing a CheY-like receiver domain and an HD-GYP domain [Paramagnetospirillum magneticum AMB-1]
MQVIDAVKLQRNIIVYAVLAMAVVGLGVALAAIIPLHRQMVRSADQALEHGLDLQVAALRETVDRMGDMARQVTSRSVIRDALSSYNQGAMSLDKLQAFTADKLGDSMKLSRDMLGILRVGRDYRPLVSVGASVPPALWSPEAGEPPALGAPTLIDGRWVLLVSAPILGRDGTREGHDLLLFDAQGLRAIVADVETLGRTGEIILGRLAASGAQVFFPRRDGSAGGDDEVAEAFSRAAIDPEPLYLTRPGAVPDVVLSQRLPGSDWIVMVRQDLAELHSNIDQLVLSVAAGALVLVGFGMVGFVLILRPLTGRMLVHTGDLKRQIKDGERAQAALERALEGTIEAVASTIEVRDPYTAGHQRRVAEIAVAIGRQLGLPAETLKGLRVAGTIHDIGKIGIPAEMLTRPGRLSALEFDIIRNHSADGCEILNGVDFPWPIADMVRHHHERMDGSGYPDGLKGDEILFEARILAVADVVEAIASDRPYRAALGLDAAMREIIAHSGTLFDAAVVDACRVLAAEGRLPLGDRPSLQ